MKSLIFAAILVTLSSFSAFADTVMRTDGLTPAQIAQYQAQMLSDGEKAQAAKNNESLVDPDHLSQYARIGRDLGSGLAATAKEMGVAVNEFAQSPVGKIATFLIVWKVIGDTLLHLLIGIAWFLVLIPIWSHLFRKLCLVKARSPVLVGNVQARTWYGKSVFEEIYYDASARDASYEHIRNIRVAMWFISFAILAVGILIMFS